MPADPFARVTVKVMRLSVSPSLPSLPDDAAMERTPGAGGAASSLTIVPVAVAVPSVPAVVLFRVTVKVSSDSKVASCATLIVIVFDVSPSAKVTTSAGKALPVKSAASAGCVPEPATE